MMATHPGRFTVVREDDGPRVDHADPYIWVSEELLAEAPTPWLKVDDGLMTVTATNGQWVYSVGLPVPGTQCHEARLVSAP